LLKGLIVEKGEKHFIVLTPTGEYKKIKGFTKMNIGQEVDIHNSFSMTKIVSLAAALLVIILLGETMFKMPGQSQVYAYVTLDINPSVEFAVDRNYAVLKAYPYNSEAEQILSGIEYLHDDINEVLADFTQAAIEHEYISDDQENYVVISVYPTNPDEPIESKLNEMTRTQNEVIVSSGKKAKVDAVVVDAKTREEAKELGISPGQLKRNQKELKEDNNIINKEEKKEIKREEKEIKKEEQEKKKKAKEKEKAKTPNKEVKEKEKALDKDNKNAKASQKTTKEEKTNIKNNEGKKNNGNNKTLKNNKAKKQKKEKEKN